MDESGLSNLTPQKIKEMQNGELKQLAGNIRGLLIETVSQNGGHLASNLGVVELTLAIHRSFDAPRDSILWDVGHQCYTHKIITGRADDFDTLRKQGGLSGFPKPEESEYDAFVAGHSSSSISIAHGMATAKRLNGDDSHTVCVIGDGSIAGGMAFEALNNCAKSREKLIIVLNDNEMSIGKSVGAMARNLTKLRNGTGYFKFKDGINRFMGHIPLIGQGLKRVSSVFKDRMRDMFLHDNLFQKIGLVYLGPIDGHNIDAMTRLFERAKTLDRTVIVHVNTVKGKGYGFAENDPNFFHGLGRFDVSTGTCEHNSDDSYSAVFGNELSNLAKKDGTICAVSAAMVNGTWLCRMPADRLFDVGIAEEHAVSFTAGLAAKGMKPVCAIYSTFLQRAYDQINQDICLANVHAVLAVDRAGAVGEDGATHQGMFDVGFLTPLPNLTVYSPATGGELSKMLKKALYEHDGPVAVRYPRGTARETDRECIADDGFSLYSASDEKDALIVTYGKETFEALNAADIAKQNGICADVLSLCRIKPLPSKAVDIASGYKRVLFAEEGMMRGGICEQFLHELSQRGYLGKYAAAAVGDVFVPQATLDETIKSLKLDAYSLFERLLSDLS